MIIKWDYFKGKIEFCFSFFEIFIIWLFGEVEGDFMVEGEEILYRNLVELDGELCGKSEVCFWCNLRLLILMGFFRLDFEIFEFIVDSV